MYGMIGSIVNAAGNLTSNLTANAANQKNFDYTKNHNFANSRVSNSMLQNYLKDGEVSADYVHQDYGDVADYLNPYLSLSANKLAHDQFKQSEEQFKVSKDLAYNGASIKANDYKRAGFNPLLAVGGSASFSPVSSGGSAPSGSVNVSPVSPINTHMSSNPFNINTNVDDLVKLAQVKNINASTDLINSQNTTEQKKPELMDKEIEKVIQDTKTSKANENVLVNVAKHELVKLNLTNKQIDYYEQSVKGMIHNLEISKKYDIRLEDQLPLLFNEVSAMLSEMGISDDDALKPYLTMFTMFILSGTSIKFNKSGKPVGGNTPASKPPASKSPAPKSKLKGFREITPEEAKKIYGN